MGQIGRDAVARGKFNKEEKKGAIAGYIAQKKNP